MKTSLKANLLKHFLAKKENGGFTLIELLVVIIIIGILSAIALPSFLNQANKARQSEARTYVGSMNRAQQAFYLENNEFANQAAFDQLGLGIAQNTQNYAYSISGGGPGAISALGRAFPGATTQAPTTIPPQSALRAYVGGVSIGTQTGTGEATTLAVLCEANAAPVNGGANTEQLLDGAVTLVNNNNGTNVPTCTAGAAPAGFRAVN